MITKWTDVHGTGKRISCDNLCGAHLDVPRMPRTAAAREGWSIGLPDDGLHVCPNCVVHVSIYGRSEPVIVIDDHGMGTIDVQRVLDGRCFRVSGLDVYA